MTTPKIIIDPGHGGKDIGGGSNEYWLEKDMVLQISLYQYYRLVELHFPVALTRDSDIYLSPEERTKIVRESGAQYCISNHINAGGGDGAEFIHSIYSDSTFSSIMAEMIRLEGQNIRRIFTRTLPYDPKKDYYFMHRNTGNVDTIIVEYGFADSALDDVEQIKQFWREYAEAIVKAVCKFFRHPYYPPVYDAIHNPQYVDLGEGSESKMPALTKANFTVNGQAIEPGYIIDGRSYAPVRAILEALDIPFRWEQETKTVHIRKEDKK